MRKPAIGDIIIVDPENTFGTKYYTVFDIREGKLIFQLGRKVFLDYPEDPNKLEWNEAKQAWLFKQK